MMEIFLISIIFIILFFALLVLMVFMKEAENDKIKNEIIEVDESLPEKTIIYYLKKRTFFNLTFFSLYTLMVMSALFSDDFSGYYENMTFGIFSLIGIIATAVSFTQFFNNNPQFIIDDSGFKIAKEDFKSWADIKNERVHVGKKSRILYEYKEEDKDLFGIYLYDANFKEIKVMLKTYRARYEHSNRHKIIS